MPVNKEKLEKLQSARIGGKGTSRRKKKIVHKTATDDKKVQVHPQGRYFLNHAVYFGYLYSLGMFGRIV